VYRSEGTTHRLDTLRYWLVNSGEFLVTYQLMHSRSATHLKPPTDLPLHPIQGLALKEGCLSRRNYSGTPSRLRRPRIIADPFGATLTSSPPER
jgi:hypothetical protein